MINWKEIKNRIEGEVVQDGISVTETSAAHHIKIKIGEKQLCIQIWKPGNSCDSNDECFGSVVFDQYTPLGYVSYRFTELMKPELGYKNIDDESYGVLPGSENPNLKLGIGIINQTLDEINKEQQG